MIEKFQENARRAAVLVDRVPWFDRAGAGPDLVVLRAYEARQAGHMISLSGCCQNGR